MGMVMAHGIDLGPRLVDFAVDHPLAVKTELRGLDRLRFEIELDEIGHFRQFRRLVAGDEIALRIAGMADADVAERVEHLLIGEDARRNDQFVQNVGEVIGHVGLRYLIFAGDDNEEDRQKYSWRYFFPTRS